MHIIHGRHADTSSQLRLDNNTGTVWGDSVLPMTDAVLINNIFFAPSARTHWHSHERGQILVVTAGEGHVVDRNGDGGAIRAGDIVFIPPGVEHWHGAGPASYLTHLAISLGDHRWLEQVSDQEYRASAIGEGNSP